jgi:hypothetical protein
VLLKEKGNMMCAPGTIHFYFKEEDWLNDFDKSMKLHFHLGTGHVQAPAFGIQHREWRRYVHELMLSP